MFASLSLSLSCVVGPRGFTKNVGFVGSSTTFLFGINSLQYADLRNNFNPAVLFDVLFFLFIASSCWFSLTEYLFRQSILYYFLQSILAVEVLYYLVLMEIDKILIHASTE